MFVVDSGAICRLVIEFWLRVFLCLAWIGSANGYACIHHFQKHWSPKLLFHLVLYCIMLCMVHCIVHSTLCISIVVGWLVLMREYIVAICSCRRICFILDVVGSILIANCLQVL